jgi:hypothetical protein
MIFYDVRGTSSHTFVLNRLRKDSFLVSDRGYAGAGRTTA